MRAEQLAQLTQAIRDVVLSEHFNLEDSCLHISLDGYYQDIVFKAMADAASAELASSERLASVINERFRRKEMGE